MNNKIAGLYVQLTKVLNALEEAGEDPWPLQIEGLSTVVEHDGERWTVAEA